MCCIIDLLIIAILIIAMLICLLVLNINHRLEQILFGLRLINQMKSNRR